MHIGKVYVKHQFVGTDFGRSITIYDEKYQRSSEVTRTVKNEEYCTKTQYHYQFKYFSNNMVALH